MCNNNYYRCVLLYFICTNAWPVEKAMLNIAMQDAPPPLLLAAKNGGVEACRLLLKFGAKIGTTDRVSALETW